MKRAALAMILILVITLSSTVVLAQARKSEKVEKAKDPVCGMMVDKDPALSSNYKGATYYFCSKRDLEEFKKAPDKYIKKP